MNTTANHHKSEAQKPDLPVEWWRLRSNPNIEKHKVVHHDAVAGRDSPAVGETVSFWFAISSPLTGILVGFLGAWFFTWLTS